MDNTYEAVRRVLNALNIDQSQRDQAELYGKIRRKEISLDEFFVVQKRLDLSMISKSTPFSWKDLLRENVDTYNHERRHEAVWYKYGVKTNLFNWNIHPDAYFVMDLDFPEVTKTNGFNVDKVISIYKEMLSASFKNQNQITNSYLMDVFFFEVLDKLDDFRANSIYEVFKKYNWQYP
ncbi:MAG: hypothetical protein M1484_04080 [Patescibacteria group bacterium]|nr:hypothetical protein [Patescibacteria group bacterium]MCL5432237.1 hypothetical protein [Patescibacteria group bacterium]